MLTFVDITVLPGVISVILLNALHFLCVCSILSFAIWIVFCLLLFSVMIWKVDFPLQIL